MIINDLLSGGLAGGAAKTVIAPLDRTKINFQIRDAQFSFREALKYLTDTYKNHGFTALWRGNSATMCRIFPYAGIQYSSHEQFKKLLNVDTNEKKRKHLKRSFCAGSLAGLFSSICVYPLDLARARMAVSVSDKIRLTDVFKMIVKNDGWAALYRGCLPSMMGIVPYAGFTFLTYETAKRYHYEITGKNEPHGSMRLAFGGLAGLVGQSASYPLDIIRRRMQTSPHKMSMRETIQKIRLDKSGFKNRWFKGLSLNWIKGPISSGVSFATFELLRDINFVEKMQSLVD